MLLRSVNCTDPCTRQQHTQAARLGSLFGGSAGERRTPPERSLSCTTIVLGGVHGQAIIQPGLDSVFHLVHSPTLRMNRSSSRILGQHGGWSIGEGEMVMWWAALDRDIGGYPTRRGRSPDGVRWRYCTPLLFSQSYWMGFIVTLSRRVH